MYCVIYPSLWGSIGEFYFSIPLLRMIYCDTKAFCRIHYYLLVLPVLVLSAVRGPGQMYSLLPGKPREAREAPETRSWSSGSSNGILPSLSTPLPPVLHKHVPDHSVEYNGHLSPAKVCTGCIGKQPTAECKQTEPSSWILNFSAMSWCMKIYIYLF